MSGGTDEFDRHGLTTVTVEQPDRRSCVVGGPLIASFHQRHERGEEVVPLIGQSVFVALTAVAAAIVDADGRQVTGPVEPGTEFYIRPQPGKDGVLLTATVPATSNGVGGRLITGVARDDSNSRLTPVALAMPAPLVVDFAIYLEGRPAAR